MRLTLIDLLIADVLFLIGVVLGIALLAPLPAISSPIAGCLGGIVVYLLAIGPIYKRLKYTPMILPRCPCCNHSEKRFYSRGTWPHATYHCATCNGEFIIWFTGSPSADETWDKPVLVPKWPYPIGGYKRLKKPAPPTTNP